LREVERILRLYREQYEGFNVRHFHEIAQRDHQVSFSYTFVKKALQGAGLVKKGRTRREHRRWREPKACFGQMLHLDGSTHRWLDLVPEQRQVLIAVVDDATKSLLYGQLWEQETTGAVMSALKEVIEQYGIPMSLYTDRAGWAFVTPKGPVPSNKEMLTQVGRALARLGIEHIPSYSPQARGRIERLNRTLQDRLVNELRLRGIRTMNKANRYLRTVFIPEYNERFAREPRDPESVFVTAAGVDLDQILCSEETRWVANDNTVVYGRVRIQLPGQPDRQSWAGRTVTVRRHLDGSYTVWHGVRLLGHFSPKGDSMGHHSTTPPHKRRNDSLDHITSGHFMC
jgi:hypothetical protein